MHRHVPLSALLIGLAIAAPPASAQGSPEREPAALAALERMGAALRASRASTSIPRCRPKTC